MRPRCQLCRRHGNRKNAKGTTCTSRKTNTTKLEPSYDCFEYAGKCQRCAENLANQTNRTHVTHRVPYQACPERYEHPYANREECKQFQPNIAVTINDHCNWLFQDHNVDTALICRRMPSIALSRAQITFGEMEGLKETLEEGLKNLISEASGNPWRASLLLRRRAAEIIEQALNEKETVVPCEYGFIAEL